MELDLFSSTAEHWGEPIDCRRLSLTAYFYSLTAEDALAMASDAIMWLSGKMSGRFWVRRCVGKRSVRLDQIMTRFQEEIQGRNFITYTEEAMAISPIVNNLKTYQDYLRKSYIYGTPTLRSDISIDYPAIWEDLFSKEKLDFDLIRHNILRIFRLEGRKHLGGYYMPDASMSMNILPYRNHPSCYYGEFRIHFTSFGLNSQLDDLAEHFAEYSEHLSQTYRNLNIQIALQPASVYESCYMQIFGAHKDIDGSHNDYNCQETEWYQTYYLPGVEWYNSISPLTQHHFCRLSADIESSQHYTVKELLGGSLVVKSRRPISQFDVFDALEMKKCLYPTLLPGMTSIPLRMLFHDNIAKESMSSFPRCTWAIVPVFEEEINLLPNHLVFTSIARTENC